MFTTDTIKIYESAIQKDLCEEIINRFDASEKVETILDSPTGLELPLRSCQELVFSQDKEWSDIQDAVTKIAQFAVTKYQSDIPYKTFPEQIGCEVVRIQKFRTGEYNDRFAFHVDVNSYVSARRFAALHWFLNDVERGGEIYFPYPNVRVKPLKGRILIHPSNWMYPTVIETPTSNDCYIMSTYLHYL